jgi:cytochrome c peroxidase
MTRARCAATFLCAALPFAAWLCAGGPAATAGADPRQARREVIELGRRLFMDPTASRLGRHSCASCHDPEKAFSDPRPRSPDDGGETRRHSQTLIDLAGEGFHWDGEFENVRQLLVARVAPPQMAIDDAAARATRRTDAARHSADSLVDGAAARARVPDVETPDGRISGSYTRFLTDGPVPPPVPTPVAARLAEDDRYTRSFVAAFGDTSITTERVLDALDAYCASIRSTTSAYDRFVAGDAAALSADEKHGLALFEGAAGCASCHLTKSDGVRAPFTDGKFHDTGVAFRVFDRRSPDKAFPFDAGRAGVTLLRHDSARFKTPTLRDVAARGPYMHDASLATLTDVVNYYARLRTADPNLDGAVRAPELSDEDVAALVAFLGTLTGVQRAGLGAPPAQREPLRVRVQGLDGKPLPNIVLKVTPFGDRFDEPAARSGVVWPITDAKGAAEVRRPQTTHLLLTNTTYLLGQSRPIPDTADAVTLIATPRSMVSLRVRRTPDGPQLPERIAVVDGADAREKPALVLTRIRFVSEDEAIYAAKAAPRPTGGDVTLVLDDRRVRWTLPLTGGAGEPLVIDAAPKARGTPPAGGGHDGAISDH